MTTALTIPDAANVPAFLRDPELARQANEEAAAGISTGFPPFIKLNGKQFALVDGNGEETPFPPSKMIQGDDGFYMPVIVLRAKKALSKKWFATAFNPNDEAKAPDCFSEDGERPDPSALAPQSETCASCPMNAFGSGKDQSGNPTAGKACADKKILAVFAPGFGVYSFALPPASLKNFGVYVKKLSGSGIRLATVVTLVGFDPAVTHPSLLFNFGGFVGEKMDQQKQIQTLEKLAELAQSPEVEDIVGRGPSVAAPKQVAGPDPAVKAAEEKAKKDAAEAKQRADAAEAKQRADAVAKAKAEAVAAQQQTAELLDDDLGLGLDAAPATATPEKPKTTRTRKAETKVEAKQESAGGVTDAELMAELGL